MKKWILFAALSGLAAAVPAQAHHARHYHHHHARHYHHAYYQHAAMSYPDTVMLDGKEYKVCKGAMMDDCVNPRQAGLSFGNVPLDTYRPKDGMPMRP